MTVGIAYHVQKFWIDIGFSLEIKYQPQQLAMHVINSLPEKIFFHIAGVTSK
jgi:hypothetical protein